MRPDVSVVMTTFNRSKLLKRAIKSVLAQTFKNWELIIIDDCSPDDTQKVVKKFLKDPRIRYIRRKENFGQHTRPKNEGIKEAQADWVCYLDDDNAYRRDHIQALWKAKENEPTYDVYYGDRMLVDERTGHKGKAIPGVRSEFNIGKMAHYNYIDTSDVLAKKSSMMAVGGWDESLKRFGDWNLWTRMIKNGATFKRVPLILTDYYLYDSSNQLKTKEMFDTASCKIWPDKTLFGPAPKMRVAVFTLTMNRLDYTKRMFKSIKETTSYEFDHFVVDNGSTDGTVDWLRDHAPVKMVIENKKNVGISKASNQALDAIGDKYDIIIKVDNDCEFESDNWLETMLDVIGRSHKTVCSPYVEGLIDHPGGTPRIRDGYIDLHYVGIVPHLGGICVAAHKLMYDKWRWKEESFLHGIQDWEFSKHCRELGGVLVYLENIKVWHMDTTAGQKKKYPSYFKKRESEKITRYEKH